MRSLSKSLLGLWVIGMGLGVTAPAQAASGVGPYYAMPAWDQTLPAATRFIVLTNMNSQAVLDRETGLVWEQSPSTSLMTGDAASLHCINLNAGGRTGWRLPTIQELLSLVDRSMNNPSLPSGHPFSIVQSSIYRSATAIATIATAAWSVKFIDGSVRGDALHNNLFAWCVRGGRGPDAQ